PTVTPTVAPTATPPPQAAPTPDAAALFEAEWAALIEAAQAEGELSLVFGTSGRIFRPMAQIFGERYGIEMIISTGSGSAGVNRVLAEQGSGRYLVDVMYGGATSVARRMIPANALDPIAELFMHPEVTDKSLWYGGKHYYTDLQQKFHFSFAATAGPENLSMHYNTDLVTQEDIDAMGSVFDFLDPKWKGKIVSLLPGSGGSGGPYFQAYVHPDIGAEWIDGFLAPELDVTFTPDKRFIVDGVTKGKFHMVIAGGSSSDLDALASLGAPVKKLRKEFTEGGGLSASDDRTNMSVPINQPHPNAAKLWVNWWLSKEGQTLMHTTAVEVRPTLRVDVTDWGYTKEEERRVEGKSYYFFTTDPEYVLQREAASDYVTTAYEASR
ncbi:MAG: extracellular solute-binding protein, partial [Chloroflexi bacterium]|nr:extracellular solute-binding protein [Chloroflexota bacterium]